MKPYLLLFPFFFLLASKLQAQNILIINDNDNIVANTDTLLSALNATIYNTYDYWSIPDSGGVVPSTALMNSYDLIVWYCSTDGVDLAMWGGTTSGHPSLISFIQTGKPLWIIGLDILYDHYATYTTFGAGEFAYDYMGLETYNYQSYLDDGNVGVPLVEKMPDAPNYFLTDIEWVFSTLWYVDGCNARAGTYELYKMGPASYPLQGEVSMFHKKTSSQSVMSTFFDPALINSSLNRSIFLESGITYLLSSNVGIENKAISLTSIWPNPASDFISIHSTLDKIAEVTLHNLYGSVIRSEKVNHVTSYSLSTSDLPNGIYNVQLKLDDGKHYSHLLQVQSR